LFYYFYSAANVFLENKNATDMSFSFFPRDNSDMEKHCG
jgi:hypothetical protein